MNRKTLKKLEEFNEQKEITIKILAKERNISRKQAKTELEEMFNQCKNPTGLQIQYEANISTVVTC